MAITADLAKLLDKAYEDKTLAELVDAPVSALAGVSDGDAKLLSTSDTRRAPAARGARGRVGVKDV